MITENKALYYEFILDESFIFKKRSYTSSIDDNNLINYINKLDLYKELNEKISIFYAYLHGFINEKFNVDGIKLPANGDRAFIITNDENKIKECKEFCHYFVNNKTVFDLLVQQIDNKAVFKSGLETVYNTLQLEKELNINGGILQKRPKI